MRLCPFSFGKVFFSFSLLITFTTNPIFSQAPDFFKFFDSCKVKGSFALYNTNDSSSFEIDAQRCQEKFSPASTFKIFNSLVALESGAIEDEKVIIKWDSTERSFSFWNQDMNMKQAFRYSAVWFYQELARRIGETTMKKYIQQCEYGNMDISGGINQFWLTGNLRISQVEQVNFLKKLYDNQLPFSLETMQTVKDIMLQEDTLGYKLRAKTGWGIKDSLDIGWYVGWVETKNNAYFFATNIEAMNPDPKMFSVARIEITKAILRELKILP